MRIARLQLENWECYRGIHVLDLEPQAYAVFARHERDGEMSNWLGKSSLLRAIRFALTGDHVHRLEDGWISEGEEKGAASLVLDDGTVIDRSRKRGKSTQLFVGKAKGDEAQALLYKAMGLTKEDFDATCWWEQGATARLVLADPAERTRIVSGWMELGPLQQAEAHNAAKLGEVVACVEELEEARKRWAAVEAAELGEWTLEAFAKSMGDAEERLVRAKRDHVEEANRVEEARAHTRLRERAEEYAKLVEEGTALRAEVDKGDRNRFAQELARARESNKVAQGNVALARREAQSQRKLATTGFNGWCPVVEMKCPAKDAINARQGETKAAAEKAEKDEAVEAKLARDAAADLEALEVKLQAHDRKRDRLQMLRERAVALQPDAEKWEQTRSRLSGDYLERSMEVRDRANAKVHEETEKLTMLAARVERIAHAEREQERLCLQLTDLTEDLITLREAALVLGRQGAQRVVATGALEDIEAGANERVREAGVELEIRVRWEHEGKGLAKACHACGHPYPESAKVKACPKCHADRGPHYINRLEFERSRTSGGADDFAGVALQLAGSAWLRETRGSAWAVGMLDEPSAQLDRSNRRALARMLRAETGNHAFEQLFVVGHHQEMLETLPGKILVTSSGKWSRVEVVS